MVFGRVGGCYPKIGPKRHPSLIIAPVNFFKGRSKSAKSQRNIVYSFFFFMFWCVSLENLQNVLISFVKLIIYGEQDMFQSSGLISNVTLKLDALVNMYCLMISVMFSSWIGTLLSSSKCNFEMFFCDPPPPSRLTDIQDAEMEGGGRVRVQSCPRYAWARLVLQCSTTTTP